MSRIRREFRSRRFWGDLATATLAAFGLLGVVAGVLAAFFPNLLPTQTTLLWVLLAACLAFGVFRMWPRAVSQEFDPGYRISVQIGDLFEQGCNTVVGMSDTFDVETPHIVAEGSIQGQLLLRVWDGDADQLRADLHEQLSTATPYERVDKAGNQWRYPIGTVACVRRGDITYFCVAYSSMDHDNKAKATLTSVSDALYSLWDTVDRVGNGAPVCCPLVGQGLSRLNVLTREASLRLIALTFALRSNQGRVASDLHIVLRAEDARRVDLREFSAFLRSLPGARL